VPRGREGWLYLGQELPRACEQSVPWTLAIRRFEQLVSIVRASGRPVVFIIPPDKSTVYPEYLPEQYTGKECAAAWRERTWATIEGTRRREVLGLRQLMLEVKEPPPDEVYWPNDTHWNTKGATIALQATLERLGAPVQVTDADVTRGHRPHLGTSPR